MSDSGIELSVQAQIDTYLSHLRGLIRRGRELRDTLAADPSSPPAITATRAWQEDCGVTINQLSGGSKAHWLARAFSQAFLMRSPAGDAVEGAAPAEIVQRLLDVLHQAVATLSAMDSSNSSGFSANAPASPEPPPPHRFDFVHNPELRPVLEQAYIDSRRAHAQADYEQSLRTSCGILEAIITDALEHKGLSALAANVPAGELMAELTEKSSGKIGDWSFITRLAVAERAGLIRGGCARLPAIARTYRDHSDADSTNANSTGEAENAGRMPISEREARQASQVLHVIMRDLDPGR